MFELGAHASSSLLRCLGMTASRFVDEYWGKKPLLVRGAFGSDDVGLISGDELAGLSLEEDVLSRIVVNEPAAAPESWSVQHGPIPEETFASLPPERWTLLVHEVDRLVPRVARLIEPFRFIPNWRFDDVMVSYAAPGGGVGAHVDRYDVFLVQGPGSRIWRVGDEPLLQPRSLDHADLNLLAAFEPAFEWEVATGDMVYIPPLFGHDGVAVEESVTYSVGFRLPAVRDILLSFVSEHVEHIAAERLLRAPLRAASENPGLIDADTLDAVRAVVRAIAYDEVAIDRWFGRYLTARGASATAADVVPDLAIEEMETALRDGATLHRPSPLDILYALHPDGGATLFANGQEFGLEKETLPLVSLVSGRQQLDSEAMAPFLEEPACTRLVARLLEAGVLEIQRRSEIGT